MLRLAAGERFVHYRVRALLGSGGMGEVYVAEDERLHRPVALKVLFEASDAFLLEARAASALNHPNVAHIYDVGRERDLAYIAMEYVEGETLERRIAAGPLPPDEVLEIAVQLADALCDAQAKGIVHRDLKPGNIVLNQRGQAKILDFGIAKMPDTTADVPGEIVGTVPYMSPEQTRGRPVDARSDQFSFGTILYEMLAGVRPFDGSSSLETMRNIGSRDPAPLGEHVPAALRRIVRRCLAKEPARRYRTPRELVAALRAVRARSGERTRRPWIAFAGVAIAIAAVLALVLILLDRGASQPPAPRIARITSAPGLEDEPALSPDGRSIAYTSDERGNLDVYVRSVDGGEPVRLTDSDADDAQPAWSPDGRRIAFVSARARGGRLSIVLGQALGNSVSAKGGDLYVVDTAGGAAVKLVDDAYYPVWSPDGAWIAFQSSRGGRWDLWKIPAAGGTPIQLTNDPEFDYQPSWSRDGKQLVYGSGMPGPYRLKVLAVDEGTSRAITDGEDGVLLKPAFAADGRSVLYSSARGGSLNLWRIAASGKRVEPERLTLGEGDDVNASAMGEDVVYASVRQTPDLWTIDQAGGAAEQVTFETGVEEFPHRASDGTLAFASDRGGADAVWLRDADGTMRQLVAAPGAGQIRWSPDGTRVVYRHHEDGETRVVIRDLERGAAMVIARDAEAPAWSPDGARLAVTCWRDQAKSQIAVVSLDGRSPLHFVTAIPLTASYPSWSPDGKSIAFQATRDDGSRHIWIVDVAAGTARPLTSGASEDSHPQWSPRDPDRIVFVRNHENLMSLRVSTGEVEPLTRFSEPNTILDYPGWSVDGTRIDFSVSRKRGDLYRLRFR